MEGENECAGHSANDSSGLLTQELQMRKRDSGSIVSSDKKKSRVALWQAERWQLNLFWNHDAIERRNLLTTNKRGESSINFASQQRSSRLIVVRHKSHCTLQILENPRKRLTRFESTRNSVCKKYGSKRRHIVNLPTIHQCFPDFFAGILHIAKKA